MTSQQTDVIERQVTVADDITIHYAESGSGTPVVCLHGTGPGSSGLSSYAPNLAALSSQFHTFVPDLPRFGKSSKVFINEPRLDFLSRVMRNFLDGVGISRAHFVGNSMGAQVAMKLAIDTPERVGRLVLMAPAAVGYSLQTPMPTEGVRLISDYYRGSGPSRDKMRQILERLVHDPANLTEQIIDDRHAASIDPETIRVNSKGPWRRQSLETELEKCVAPTLLIWGQDDRATPFDTALLLLKKLPDARLHVFPKCGHWANVERADEFNALVVDFLNKS